MHKLPIFALVIIPLATTACSDDPTSTSITISTERAPEAIAYRDGLDGSWRTLTPTSTGSYKLDVTGPYMVSVVCSSSNGSLVSTRQIARTPEDGTEIELACAKAPQLTSSVKGKMVQPGAVSVGDARIASDVADWGIDLDVPAGTFDLLGITADRIMIRRDLAVSGELDVGTLDVQQQGVELVPVALTASNAATGEDVEAEVMISTAKTEGGLVHRGAPASAKLAPTAFLTGDLRQSVAMIGTKGDDTRLVRRELHTGDPTAFALPEPLGPVQFAAADGKLVATWSALPDHDKVVLSLTGSQAIDRIREHTIELSQSFLDETRATSATIDTNLPGYQAAWRLDLARAHQRTVQVVRERDGVHAESTVTKQVDAQP
jgi:hypothetical protein